MFFRFPPDARWNAQRSVVEFGIGVGEYHGVVRVSRRVFQILLSEAPTPERCLEAYHLHRTRLEVIAERKVRRRQLTMTAMSRLPVVTCANGNPKQRCIPLIAGLRSSLSEPSSMKL